MSDETLMNLLLCVEIMGLDFVHSIFMLGGVISEIYFLLVIIISFIKARTTLQL